MNEQFEETNDGFLSPDGFDANWFDRIDSDLADEVVKNGKILKTFDNTGSTWWTLYSLKGVQYVGMCDFSDIWLLDDEMAERVEVLS